MQQMNGARTRHGFKGKVAELAVASAALLIATALSYMALVRQLQDRDSITNAHIVLEKLGAVRSNVAEAEGGERGYLLNGEDAYLEPYGRAVQDLARNLYDLRQLTGDNAMQQDALDRLDRLVTAKLEYLDQHIQVRRQQLPGATVWVVREEPGKQLMEQINLLLAAIKEEEDRLMVQRAGALQSSASKTKMTMGVLAGLSFIFIFSAGVIVQKEMTARARVEEQFRCLLEFAPESIVVVNQKGEIVLVNAQTEKVFGYSRRELFRQRVEMLIPQRFQQQHPGLRTQLFGDSKGGPSGAALEICGLRKDGTEFPVEISVAPLETAEGTFVSCAIRDISDRKQIQEALRRQAEEVERHRSELALANVELIAANQELESFSYSVSHDLRAPLRTIDGFSLALLEDCADKLDAQGRGYLHRVRDATQRMGILIDDILDLSRVTRAEMIRESVDLSSIARSVLGELAVAQPDRHAEMKIKGGLNAIGDSHLLHIALENLLGNAWKFTSKLEMAHIEFDETSSNGAKILRARRWRGIRFRSSPAFVWRISASPQQRRISRHRYWPRDGAAHRSSSWWAHLGQRGCGTRSHFLFHACGNQAIRSAAYGRQSYTLG
jgi:PAS domain S-box-containing protein